MDVYTRNVAYTGSRCAVIALTHTLNIRASSELCWYGLWQTMKSVSVKKKISPSIFPKRQGGRKASIITNHVGSQITWNWAMNILVYDEDCENGERKGKQFPHLFWCKYAMPFFVLSGVLARHELMCVTVLQACWREPRPEEKKDWELRFGLKQRKLQR